jgi:hypothetical protein
MNWLKSLWYRHLRRIDMQILWPACVEKAPDLEHARAAFALHAFNDPAWLALGEGIYSAIDHLGE